MRCGPASALHLVCIPRPVGPASGTLPLPTPFCTFPFARTTRSTPSLPPWPCRAACTPAMRNGSSAASPSCGSAWGFIRGKASSATSAAATASATRAWGTPSTWRLAWRASTRSLARTCVCLTGNALGRRGLQGTYRGGGFRGGIISPWDISYFKFVRNFPQQIQDCMPNKPAAKSPPPPLYLHLGCVHHGTARARAQSTLTP